MSSPAEHPPSGSGGPKKRRLDAIPPKGFRARKAAAEAGLTHFPMHHPAVRPLRVEKKKRPKNERGDKRGKGRGEGPDSPEDGPMSRGEKIYREELARVTEGNRGVGDEQLVLATRGMLLEKEHHLRALREFKERVKANPELSDALTTAKETLGKRETVIAEHLEKMPEEFAAAMERSSGDPKPPPRERHVRAWTAFQDAKKASPAADKWFKELEGLEGERDVAKNDLRALQGSAANSIETLEKLYGADRAQEFASVNDTEREAERARIEDALDYIKIFTNRDDSRDEQQTGTGDNSWERWARKDTPDRAKALSGEAPYPYTEEQNEQMFDDRVYGIEGTDKKGRPTGKPMKIELASGKKSDEIVLPNPGRAMGQDHEAVLARLKSQSTNEGKTGSEPKPLAPGGISVEPNQNIDTTLPSGAPLPENASTTDLASQADPGNVGRVIGELMEDGRQDKRRLREALRDLVKVSTELVGGKSRFVMGEKKKEIFNASAHRLAKLIAANGLPERSTQAEVDSLTLFLKKNLIGFGNKRAVSFLTTDLSSVLADGIKELAKIGIITKNSAKVENTKAVNKYLRQLAKSV